MAPALASDLGKLTVPQLKALCKEQRITGYSKLSKAALLQRLAEVSAPAKTTPSNDQASRNRSGTATSSSTPAPENPANFSAFTGPSAASRAVCQPIELPSAGNSVNESTGVSIRSTTAKAPLPTGPPGSSQGCIATGTQSIQETAGKKRPAHIDISASRKRIRETLASATPPNDQANRSATVVPTVASTTQDRNPDNSFVTVKSSAPSRAACSVTKEIRQPVQPQNVGTQSTGATTVTLPTELAESSQNHTATSIPNAQKTAGAKRPAHIDTSTSPKRIRTFPASVTTSGHESPVPRTSTFQQKPPTSSAVSKVPELPASHKRSLQGSAPTLAKQPANKIKPSTPRQIAGGPGRFKPLVVSKLRNAEPDTANTEPPRAPVVPVVPRAIEHTLLSSGLLIAPLPVLSQISFPPKASERKWIYQWAIVLSALPPVDRRTCTLVSRTFRYAVYLSAIHILLRNYAGRRLDVVLKQYPRDMTNFWPYLQLRMTEMYERRRVFQQSFLGRYTSSIGYDPLSQHLWASPDDEKQVDIALRFVLSRMWFAISVGTYGHDASTWSRCVVRDVREVVNGEIWRVVTHDNDTGESCSFYVLEATCEVIGQPPSSQGEDTLGYHVRADWSAWISQRSRSLLDAGPPSLLEWVKWSNTEDYHLGISKAWLRRVQGRDAECIAKKTVAERYILASVMANGISGPWMSTSAMAQEFAGLPRKGVLCTKTAGRSVNSVNMYLPAHHHIESVHFTTSKGDALHDGVSVVQTPGREYYVLRGNGMQVGCEEEGIPDVWQQILGCDSLGRAR